MTYFTVSPVKILHRVCNKTVGLKPCSDADPSAVHVISAAAAQLHFVLVLQVQAQSHNDSAVSGASNMQGMFVTTLLLCVTGTPRMSQTPIVHCKFRPATGSCPKNKVYQMLTMHVSCMLTMLLIAAVIVSEIFQCCRSICFGYY